MAVEKQETIHQNFRRLREELKSSFVYGQAVVKLMVLFIS